VYAYATQRRFLDTFLAEKAVEAGTTFHQREEIKSVERKNGIVSVGTAGNNYQAHILVGADGVNGATSKLCGIAGRSDFEYAIGMEGNITLGEKFENRWSDSLGVDFGSIEGGYAWLFPKGDHVNIGIGGYYHVGPTLRGALKKLVRFYGFDPSDLWGIRGYSLPLRLAETSSADGKVLLVGDAAGLLDPLTAEGIWAAVQSGQIAASTIIQYLEGNVKEPAEYYKTELESSILQELGIARRLRKVFYPAPGAYFTAEKLFPHLWSSMTETFSGNSDYINIFRKIRFIFPLIQSFAWTMGILKSRIFSSS